VKSIPTAALVAIILWGTVALAPIIRAQDDPRKSGQSLTNDSLRALLDNLGYEPKKLTSGYLVAIKKDGWTYNMQFVLSDDKTKIGLNANLGLIEKLDAVTAPQWMGLLTANKDIDPSFFYVDKDQKKLYMHRVLDNRAITPSYIRQQTDNFCGNIKETSDAWKFTK
jgi:hypothetical protein